MKCPRCGSPVPLGSGICFDCGSRIAASERDPWDLGEQPVSHVLRGRGEQAYLRDQRRQAIHERIHESHSVSARAAASDYEHGFLHPSPARQQSDSPAKQQPAGGAKKKSSSAVLVILIVLFYLLFAFLGVLD